VVPAMRALIADWLMGKLRVFFGFPNPPKDDDQGDSQSG